MSEPTAERLPTGVVTFLFTDIEGSTQMVQRLGADYDRVLAGHAAIVRDALATHHGVEVSTEGDSFFAVFASPADGIAAALAIQRGLRDHSWSQGAHVLVRMGLHTGEGRLGGDNYVGVDVNRAARISAAGHGGQILLSETTGSLVADRMEPGAVLDDKGRHRLKGLERAERILELRVPDLHRDFPPLRTAGTPTNLPAQPSPFVGRVDELAALGRLLGAHRLVTITGPGGVGKTRLAIAAAASVLDDHTDGVFYAGLDTVSDTEGVETELARAVGSPTGGTDPVQAVVDTVGSGSVLLVVDNFEHVLPAADRIARLLRECPDLTVLVTSQSLLRLRGEQSFPLAPMDLPTDATPDGVAHSDSGRLFVGAVRELDPGFELSPQAASTIREILTLLDSLPLAIELAAARVRLFGLEGLRDQLATGFSALGGGRVDAPARQRTLAEMVDWSYRLLEPADQAVLRRASVFVDGAGLDALQAVAAQEPVVDVISSVASLLDKSLIRSEIVAGGPRYQMLRSVRDYAAEQLDGAGERDGVRARHAHHFLGAARDTVAEYRGRDAFGAVERLATDSANLLAAWDWACGNDPALGLHALEALTQGAGVIGTLTVTRHLSQRLLGAADVPDDARLAGLLGAAAVEYWLQDYDGARALYEQSVALAESLHDLPRLAEARFGLSYTYGWLGDLESADRELAATDLAASRGAVRGDLEVRGLAGFLAWKHGDVQEAARLFADVQADSRDAGLIDIEMRASGVLTGMLLRAGQFRAAIPGLLDALVRLDDHRHKPGLSLTLSYFAVAVAGIDPATGVRLASGVESVGAAGVRITALGIPGAYELASASLDDAQIAELKRSGQGLDMHDALRLARDWAAAEGFVASPLDPDVVHDALERTAD